MTDIENIDFSKAPEGATHYGLVNCGGDIVWYKNICGQGYEFYTDSRIGTGHFFDRWLKNKGNTEYHAIPIHEQWSIYTNDKPLSELGDEQAAMLFNHWRSGGELEFCASSHQWRGCTAPEFYKNHIYRALKPKSERELFVEQCTKVMREAGTKCPDNHEYFGVLFDSGKFQLKDSEK